LRKIIEARKPFWMLPMQSSRTMPAQTQRLWTDQGKGEKIVRYFANDEFDEAKWVIARLKELHDDEHRKWSDLAVFYRTNAQSRVLEESLTHGGVPYKVVGGTKFYDRREIKDALAYLRLASNPLDEVSIKRVLERAKARHWRHHRQAKVDAYANETGISFALALRRAAEAGVGAAGVRESTRLCSSSTSVSPCWKKALVRCCAMQWNEAGTCRTGC
jgi:superfamily I DNA/RNA helicase